MVFLVLLASTANVGAGDDGGDGVGDGGHGDGDGGGGGTINLGTVLQAERRIPDEAVEGV